MNDGDSYVGKYVVYDQMDGGACWGRIKAEVFINTMDGEKAAFILEDRYVRYAATTDRKRFRRFFPDMNDPTISRPMEMGSDGNLRAGDVKLHIERVYSGDSLLRLDMIDVEKDIVDMEGMLDLVSTETLFLAVMAGREQRVDGKDALEIGIRYLLKSSDEFDEAAKKELKRRIDQR